MSFWSSVWESAESAISSATSTPVKTDTSKSSSNSNPQTTADTPAKDTETPSSSTPGAILEEGWASLSSSFLDAWSSTPSKIASALSPTPLSSVTPTLATDKTETAKKYAATDLSQEASSSSSLQLISPQQTNEEDSPLPKTASLKQADIRSTRQDSKEPLIEETPPLSNGELDPLSGISIQSDMALTEKKHTTSSVIQLQKQEATSGWGEWDDIELPESQQVPFDLEAYDPTQSLPEHPTTLVISAPVESIKKTEVEVQTQEELVPNEFAPSTKQESPILELKPSATISYANEMKNHATTFKQTHELSIISPEEVAEINTDAFSPNAAGSSQEEQQEFNGRDVIIATLTADIIRQVASDTIQNRETTEAGTFSAKAPLQVPEEAAKESRGDWRDSPDFMASLTSQDKPLVLSVAESSKMDGDKDHWNELPLSGSILSLHGEHMDGENVTTILEQQGAEDQTQTEEADNSKTSSDSPIEESLPKHHGNDTNNLLEKDDDKWEKLSLDSVEKESEILIEDLASPQVPLPTTTEVADQVETKNLSAASMIDKEESTNEDFLGSSTTTGQEQPISESNRQKELSTESITALESTESTTAVESTDDEIAVSGLGVASVAASKEMDSTGGVAAAEELLSVTPKPIQTREEEQINTTNDWAHHMPYQSSSSEHLSTVAQTDPASEGKQAKEEPTNADKAEQNEDLTSLDDFQESTSEQVAPSRLEHRHLTKEKGKEEEEKAEEEQEKPEEENEKPEEGKERAETEARQDDSSSKHPITSTTVEQNAFEKSPVSVAEPHTEALHTETPIVISSSSAPTLSSPSLPSESDSSSAIKHLESKVHVLTKILEQREQQLANKSSALLDLQSENDEMKQQVEIFKAAQARQNSSSKSSSSSSTASIDALQQEFSDRIATMENKYRAAVKERENLRRQVEQLKQASSSASASTSTHNNPSTSTNASLPLTPSASRLLSPFFAALSPASSATSSPAPTTSPSTPTSNSTQQVVTRPSSANSTTASDAASQSDHASNITASSTSSVEDQLRQEGMALQEKVQIYESKVRELRKGEKNLKQTIAGLETKLTTFSSEKQAWESEREALKERERRMKVSLDSQKEVVALRTKQYEDEKSKSLVLERDLSGTRKELEAAWKSTEELKKAVESEKTDTEFRIKDVEKKLRGEFAEELSTLGARSMQQHIALQATITDLRAALDGDTKKRGLNEEAMEDRIRELERELQSAQHYVSMSRQNSNIVTSPLLKQISDLQTQLANQQLSIESIEEAWKSRTKLLESQLASSASDLAHAQSQYKFSEQNHQKLQAQYHRLEQQYQTLQITAQQSEDDILELSNLNTSLQASLDESKSQIVSLTQRVSQLMSSAAEYNSTAQSKISELELTISKLQQRIQSLTTVGSSTHNEHHSLSHHRTVSANIQSSPPSPSHSRQSTSTGMTPSSSTIAFATPTQSRLHSSGLSSSSIAIETQLEMLRTEKSRLEDLLANALHTSSLSESYLAKISQLEEENERMNERLCAALELVAEKSERLAYVDEDLAETKQLYKTEIVSLVSQLQEAQQRVKELREQMMMGSPSQV